MARTRSNPSNTPLYSHPQFHAIIADLLGSSLTVAEIAAKFNTDRPNLYTLSAAVTKLRDNGLISGIPGTIRNPDTAALNHKQEPASTPHPAPSQQVAPDPPSNGQPANHPIPDRDCRDSSGGKERFSARKRIAAGSLRKNEGRVRELELMYQRKWQIVRRRVRMYRQYRDTEPGADSGFLQRVERGSSGVTWVQWEYDKDLARDLRAILEAIAKELHQDQLLTAAIAAPATKIYSAPGSTVHIHTDAAAAPTPAPIPALEAPGAVIDIRRHETVSVSGASVAG